jgi:cytochrome c553
MIIIIVFSLASLSVSAKDDEFNRMLSDITKKQSVPELKERAIRMGKERALLCSQCHGDDGNSKKPDVPNLAQQNPTYLLEQIEKFANGSRKNYVMNVLSKNFTRVDKVNLALLYANMQLKQVKTDPQLAIKGQPLYTRQCSACHGDRGIGKEDFARLAGQQIHYVENTLRRFRDNANNKSNGDSVTRRNAIMESITRQLTDDNIKALAAYIAQIK